MSHSIEERVATRQERQSRSQSRLHKTVIPLRRRVLLSAPFEPETAPAGAAGTEDSRKAKATWQSASTDVLSQSKCRQLSLERLPFGTHSPFQARRHLLQTMISYSNLPGAGSSSFEAEYASRLKYGTTVQRAGNRVQTRLCKRKTYHEPNR